MKKILALICALAMLFVFCGCRETTVETTILSYYDGEDVTSSEVQTENDGTVSQDNTATGSKENSTANSVVSNGSNSVINNPLDADLKGATVTIYDIDSIFAPDASKSKTAAAKADMIKKLEKELNCKLEIKKTDIDKLASLAAASAAGGKAISQIITVPVSRMGYFISSNLVADMGKISSMDLSKDYMNTADMPEASRFAAGRYAVAADGTVTAGIVFNKRILEELGYDANYIYGLVDAGKWTYEEFRKLAKEATKDLDGKSGMSEKDQWGIAVMDMETGATADLLVSSKTPMIQLNNGKLVSNMTNANISKVANLLRDTYKNDGTTIDTTGTKSHDAFKNGNVFMEYTTSEVMHLYANMKDEFGFVPVPQFVASKTYNSAIDWNYKGLMIPAGLSAQDQYNAGAVVQAYMYLMQDIYKVKTNEYVNRYFCDDESGDNLALAMKGVTMHPVQCYAKVNETILTGTYRVFWNYISRGDSVATAVESSGTALQKALDDLNTKIKDK